MRREEEDWMRKKGMDKLSVLEDILFRIMQRSITLQGSLALVHEHIIFDFELTYNMS